MERNREKLMLEGFTVDQIDEIIKGQEEGIDVSIYARKEYFALQMRQIREGLLERIDVSRYASPEYDWFQMEEIRIGLEQGINIDIYANPSIPYDQMRQVRKGLEQGIDLSKYTHLEAGMIRQIRKAFAVQVNIIDYIKQGYDPEQLEEIRLALEKKVYIEPYLSVKYRGMAIRQICDGLEKGIDVSVYAKEEFSWRQMQEIRIGLENRVDISYYAHKLYSWQQMREIRLGLENGLEVKKYKSLMYTASEMKKKRLQLQRDAGISSDAYLSDVGIPVQTENPEEKKTFPDFFVVVSEDCMEVYVTITSEIKPLKREELELALRQEGIRSGIDEDALQMLEQGTYDKMVVTVAKGKQPEDGKDGWYEFLFRTDLKKEPKLLPDGSVDYQNIEWFECVKEGQEIAKYHEPTQGINGWNVLGRILSAKRGKEKKILTGVGFNVSPDQKLYTAAMSGKIELLYDERIEITQFIIVDDVTLATGNVKFVGSVYVRGSIERGCKVEATDDVIVDGFVDDGIVECGGSVILRNGMNGGEVGYIKAGKCVTGKFFEYVKIYAEEDITADYCLGCNLYAGGQIIVTGLNGSIVGGVNCAIGGITASNIGNHIGVGTYLKVGINDAMISQMQSIERSIMGVKQELTILQNAHKEFMRKYSPEVRNTMELFLKIENAIYTKENEIEKLFDVKSELTQKMERLRDVKVIVKNKLFLGVVMEINRLHWNSKEFRSVTIKSKRGEIVAYSN